MLINKRLYILLISLLVLVGCQSSGGTRMANSSAEINRDVDHALHKLYASTPAARTLAARAKGILVFPSIVKAGFMVGAQYGRGGALRVKGRTVGYYNSVAASYGLQAGVQSFGYALFFMNNAAMNYLNRSEGWEIGVGPSIVVVDAGVARSLTTTTAKDNVYAFIFDQKGLMAGLGLQGSKITRIYPD
ncbi:MAG: twin-arginine translocation pathway signal protein [Methylococcaceae bacterium]|nr:twin-arginine translocation pathway signal protein [Methylococcaceae bacterium]